MTVQTAIEQTSKIIRKYISQDYKIVLFGSFTKGNALPESDIDIAIYGKEKIAPNVLSKNKRDVENLRTLKKIDIVDLMAVDNSYRKNILSYSKEIS